MPQWLSMLIGAALSLSGSAVVALLGLRIYRRQRWWERKVEAYSRIIEAIYDCGSCTATWADIPQKPLNTDKVQEMLKGFKAAEDELNKQASIGAYVISNEAAAALLDFARKIQKIRLNKFEGDDAALYESLKTEAQFYKEALETLRVLAKRDLNVE